MPVTAIEVTNSPVLSGQVPIDGITFDDSVISENSYSHVSRALGGYWLMEFSIKGSLDKLEFYLLTFLMKHVRSYNHRSSLVWEGFINSMVLTSKGYTAQVSLDTMANRVWTRYLSAGASVDSGATVQQYDAEGVVRHQAEAAAGGTFSRTGNFEDTDSQGKYGIKEMVLSAGQLPAIGPANQAAEQYLNKSKDPINPAVDFSLGRRSSKEKLGELKFTCFGYMRTLAWRRYNQIALSGNIQTNLLIEDIITAVGQFIDTVEAENNITNVNKKMDIDRDALSMILDFARMGEPGGDRFTASVYEDRKLVFAGIDDNQRLADYTINTQKGAIYNAGKGIVFPEEMRAGRYALGEDLFKGIVPEDQFRLLTDPRASYIEEINFSDPGDVFIKASRQDLADVVVAQLGNNSIGI